MRLGASQEHDPAELLDGHLFVEKASDLCQTDAEVAQSQDPVQAAELLGLVPLVPAVRIDPDRSQQADLVVVPKRPNRDPRQAGDRADPEHLVIEPGDAAEESSGRPPGRSRVTRPSSAGRSAVTDEIGVARTAHDDVPTEVA